MNRTAIARWLITIGLVIVFVYFGIDKFLSPTLWIGFMPTWIDGVFGLSANVWLSIVGVIEIVLAVMLLVSVRWVRQTGAILMALHLLTVIIIVGWNDIGARDLGLLLSALSLFFLA